MSMNQKDRQNKQWDEAAEQAKSAEGVSSFGKMCGGWKPAAIMQYAKAAKDRGVTFAIDESGVGYFVEAQS